MDSVQEITVILFYFVCFLYTSLEENEILEEITLHTRIHTYACSLIFIPQEKLCIEQCGFLRFTCLMPSTRYAVMHNSAESFRDSENSICFEPNKLTGW